MAGARELEKSVKQQYFEPVASPPSEQDEGTREMGILYPFLISGGSNTERYYFIHINDTTEHKFNIIPEYFGDESNYTESFPKRIEKIFKANNDAKIFCVFDWDTVFGNYKCLKKHQEFIKKYEHSIAEGRVTMCPSMPCIEYWFLLHFEDTTEFLRDYPAVASKLATYMKACFPDSKKRLKTLLKTEKYIKDSSWVKNLCADGKMSLAIERAKKNIHAAEDTDELDNRSYSYVYKVFLAG